MKKKKNKKLLVVVSVVLLIIFSFVIYNNNSLTTREEKISSEKFKDLDNYTVIYFSDLHYTNFIKEKFLEKVIKNINSQNPDLVIFGGDLIDKLQDKDIKDKQKETLIKALNNINAKDGKYAILGNHDYSKGSYEIVKEIYDKSGFILLKDQCSTVKIENNNAINLLGIDSLFFSWDPFIETYNDLDIDNYTFAIIHHPDLIDFLLDYNFDYVLSGHSHGGQVYLPLFKQYYNFYGCNKYFSGKYIVDNINKNFVVDVSSGVGRTRINLRLNAKAEIVKYELSSTK